jgi:hypothetical protein
MARYCDVCGQSYAVAYESCPFCDLPARAGRHRPPDPGETRDQTPLPTSLRQADAAPAPCDAEIDLGSPVHAAQESLGPPSGASFVSWTAHLPGGAPPPAEGPLSSARLLLNPTSPPESGDVPANPEAEIDLGSPVRTGPREDDGPPSGASFVAWSALLPARPTPAPTAEAAAPRALDFPATDRSTGDTTATPPRGSWTTGLVVGILAGMIVCIGLWLIGFEPPPNWRRPLNEWFGPSPPADVSPNQKP